MEHSLRRFFSASIAACKSSPLYKGALTSCMKPWRVEKEIGRRKYLKRLTRDHAKMGEHTLRTQSRGNVDVRDVAAAPFVGG